MEKYLIKATADGYIMTTAASETERVTDGHNQIKFQRSQGFESVEDCKQYAAQYLRINPEQITTK